MAGRTKTLPSTDLGHIGQAGGVAGEDADAILDTALAIVRADLARIQHGARSSARPLDLEQAQTVAGYVRALGGIARARNGRGKGELGKLSMDELLAEVRNLPEVMAALEASR